MQEKKNKTAMILMLFTTLSFSLSGCWLGITLAKFWCLLFAFFCFLPVLGAIYGSLTRENYNFEWRAELLWCLFGAFLFLLCWAKLDMIYD
jgi:hypothetical protein